MPLVRDPVTHCDSELARTLKKIWKQLHNTFWKLIFDRGRMKQQTFSIRFSKHHYQFTTLFPLGWIRFMRTRAPPCGYNLWTASGKISHVIFIFISFCGLMQIPFFNIIHQLLLNLTFVDLELGDKRLKELKKNKNEMKQPVFYIFKSDLTFVICWLTTHYRPI